MGLFSKRGNRQKPTFSPAGPPAHQSPSAKPQTLDPQLSHQQLQVQDAGQMVNHTSQPDNLTNLTASQRHNITTY